MHSMPVSVCPCLSETACAHTFCMWLHCFDMLSGSDLCTKTESSSSWDGSPKSFQLDILVYIFHRFSILWFSSFFELVAAGHCTVHTH